MAKIHQLQHRIIHLPEGRLGVPDHFLLGNYLTLEWILILKSGKFGLERNRQNVT